MPLLQIIDSNTDMNLGALTFAGNAKLSCPLALAGALVTAMQAGGEVGLFMTAIGPTIGYVFYSRHYGGNPSSLPSLVVSAVAQPGIVGITLSGTNLVLSATNGVAGGTYYVLTSTNLSLPLGQWTPIETNILAGSGNFVVTVTNAASLNPPLTAILVA